MNSDSLFVSIFLLKSNGIQKKDIFTFYTLLHLAQINM